MNFLLNESHEKNKVGVDTNLYTPEQKFKHNCDYSGT